MEKGALGKLESPYERPPADLDYVEQAAFAKALAPLRHLRILRINAFRDVVEDDPPPRNPDAGIPGEDIISALFIQMITLAICPIFKFLATCRTFLSDERRAWYPTPVATLTFSALHSRRFFVVLSLLFAYRCALYL